MLNLRKAYRRWRYWNNPRTPLERLIQLHMTERPQYAYGLYYGALLAKRLGYSRVSAAEFGVAGGNGLVYMEKIATRVEAEVGIKVEVYGFDLGSGLPAPEGHQDLPYWWKEGFYEMDEPALRARLERSELVLGPIAQTVPRFVERADAAPFAFIALDLDYYSSTRDALRLFDGNAEARLPRCILYLDDVVGGPWEMYGREVGMLKAVEDFNAEHDTKKIMQNRNLVAVANRAWHHQIYYMHDFQHPAYGHYVGGEEQVVALEQLSLSRGG